MAFPSSYLLLHNRPNVYRIRGILTCSSQVGTPDINYYFNILFLFFSFLFLSVERFSGFRLDYAVNPNTAPCSFI